MMQWTRWAKLQGAMTLTINPLFHHLLAAEGAYTTDTATVMIGDLVRTRDEHSKLSRHLIGMELEYAQP